MGYRSDWFRRFLLPGFAFKAVVIGGGYATGRELATFFLPSGPRGGLYAIALATAMWCVVCATTFLFAWRNRSCDYRSFFRHLLGPFWPAFEFAFALGLMVTLAVFAASAGAIGTALFGVPPLVGTMLLMATIAGFSMFGNHTVEILFKYVSIFLYVIYAAFLLLSLTHFSGEIAQGFARPTPTTGWVQGGLAYGIYNVAGAVVVLPMIRHIRSDRDAVTAGLLAGPLAMLPALFFFVAMTAFYPEIGSQALPSDFLLERLGAPAFRFAFQTMIFMALVESGVGGVHAINERIAATLEARGGALSRSGRLLVTTCLLAFSVFVATRIGLIALVAGGYRILALTFLIVFVLPLFTRGVWMILSSRANGTPAKG
jgi:uncharacterized membrane protein YkvI